MTKPDLSPYFTLLGQFTHWRAITEHGMDVTMAVIYHKYDTDRMAGRKLPGGGFCQKVTYLRGAIAKVPSIVPYVTKLSEVLDRTEKLSEGRHLFTHGIPLDFDAPEPTILMYKINIEKGSFLIKQTERAVKRVELEAMVDEAMAIAVISTDLAQETLRQFL